MTEINGLAAIIGSLPEGYAQSAGPERKPNLPITYWYPAWWGISPWASPYWSTSIDRPVAPKSDHRASPDEPGKGER